VAPVELARPAPGTITLRQPLALSHEAPFMHLLLGRERALLLDTGAVRDAARFPLRARVDRLLDEWLASNPRSGYQLIVAHTHGHGDHVAGDPQFADRPGTTVVGRDLASVQAFFGLAGWPDGRARLDLGERPLDVIPLPGHHPAHIAVLDRATRTLFTGDAVYPGRLYVEDMPAFRHSLDRLVALAEEADVARVLGGHVEMSRTGRDYPLGARRHPDEADLVLPPEALGAVRDAAAAVAARPGAHRFPGFVIYNGPCRRETARLVVRGAWSRLRGSV
jgi:glyoxylase-like metal-dependent hydrolase (beta-lactamase superfamily II)